MKNFKNPQKNLSFKCSFIWMKKWVKNFDLLESILSFHLYKNPVLQEKLSDPEIIAAIL